MASAFYGPRSRENARLLLEVAEEVGVHPREIRTQNNGYLVPESVVDAITARQDEFADGAETAPDDEDGPQGDQGAADGTEEQDATAKRPSVTEAKAGWLTYAQEHLGLAVTDDNTKAEIIEAVKAEEATD